MPTQLNLGRGRSAWLEGKDNDIAINDPAQHALIVLTQVEFDKLDAFRRTAKEGRDHG
jgi:hypothetical protein